MSLYAPGLFRWRLLPFGRLWYAEPNAVSNAIGYAIHYTRSHDAVIRVYDEVGNVIEMHKHTAISKSRSGRFSGSNGFRFLNAEQFGTIS